MRKRWIYISFILATILTVDLFGKREDPPLLQVGVGIFHLRRPQKWQGQASIEYKWHPLVYTLRPFVGIMGTQKGSLYGYGGFGLDLFIHNRFVITPSLAAGLYYRGHGKNLGYPLEFRSSLEAAFVFKSEGRLGLQMSHISNASLGHKNPGAESLVLFYSIPL